MSVRPDVLPVAERLYTAIGATTEGDDSDWLLLKLCAALSLPLDAIEVLAADTDIAEGWTSLLDLDLCPPESLPWLAQFVGVLPLPGLSDAAQRARIAGTGGWKRGTPDSIAEAARQWLIGEQQVTLLERVGGAAYQLQVTVHESEVLDLDQLTAAVRAAVPAGVVAALHLIPIATFGQWEDAYAGQTFAQAEDDHAGESFSDVERATP